MRIVMKKGVGDGGLVGGVECLIGCLDAYFTEV